MSIAPGCSDFPRQLFEIGQLDGGQLAGILSLAGRYADGEKPRSRAFSAGLLMLQPSLRTRLGFAEAIRRLGGTAHLVTDLREAADASAPESLTDALRVAGGFADILIVRADTALRDAATLVDTPLINAGDASEHPTQALIDLFAFERLVGPTEDLAVGVCGDMGMRSARSLLHAFRLRPPRTLRIVAPPTRMADAEALTSAIPCPVTFAVGADWSGLDILHLVGLRERRGEDVLDAGQRAAFAVTASTAPSLPFHAGIFSPMPIIDEIDPGLRCDPRMHAYRQSDLSVFVRMAVVEWMLEGR